MGWMDYAVLAVIAIIIGSAVTYIRKTKKSGRKCIGCPDGGNCANKKSGCCACDCSNSHLNK